MATQLIELQDGTLIEAEVIGTKISTKEEEVTNSIAQIKPILLRVSEPIVAVWKELSSTVKIDQAEVEIGFGIEAKGNFFIAQSTAKANISIKLTIKPSDPKDAPTSKPTV